MGIFIVEEMYRTGEIRPEDDKDLSLTQPINRCLQMIKADRSKQTHSFLPQIVWRCPNWWCLSCPQSQALLQPMASLEQPGSAGFCCSHMLQQLQCLGTAFGRETTAWRNCPSPKAVPECPTQGVERAQHHALSLGPARLLCCAPSSATHKGHLQQSPRTLP